MSVLAGVEADLELLPRRLQNGALAASARRLAEQMDDEDNSATSISMCAKALESVMGTLLASVPAEPAKDKVSSVADRHAARRRGAVSAHQPDS